MADAAYRTTYSMVDNDLYVCDPIHGTYVVSKPFVSIVQTKEMQRLKEITQTGFSFYDYPNMQYEDRLAHSLGAYHIMEKILIKLSTLLKGTNVQISNEDKEIALCAILLHDIGHGPFSHCFETISNYYHEKRTTDILLGNTEVNEVLTKQFGMTKVRRIASFIADIDESENKDEKFESTAFERLIKSLISHQIDADRLDYLVRDAYYAGIESSINVDKIINAISIAMNAHGEYEIIMDKRNLTLIETPLIERFQHYRDIYFTPGSVIGDRLFKNLIREMRCNPEKELEKLLPYEFLQLVKNPEKLSLDDFLKLTDVKVYDSLVIIKRNTKNPVIKRLASGNEIVPSFMLFEDVFIKGKIHDFIKRHISIDDIKSENSIYEIYSKTKFYKKDEGFKIRSNQNIVDLTDVTNLVNAKDYVEMKCTVFCPEIFYFENKLDSCFKSLKDFLIFIEKYISDIHVKEEEFELKYLISKTTSNSDACIKAKMILNLLLSEGFEKLNEKEIINNDKYFDTDKLDLYFGKKILRIRNNGKRIIGTYKAPLLDGSIYTSRIEIEEKLEKDDFEILINKISNRNIVLPQNIDALPKIFVTNKRNECILCKNGSKVSFCIDNVFYSNGEVSFYEVMIEIEALNDIQDRFLLTEINDIIMKQSDRYDILVKVTNMSKYSRGIENLLMK